ncbi:flagellar hook capping FlgD N-terminal domain-containing protein [Roseinatronobacter bogoriensis]|uniref:Basal-body rod modification protein FlgD n=1 Tax=Roseinatronobacter bogoriensis subsp. barguzinensis TaxID=441209 RepID=A0A2K8K8N8_9RHOB|nr:MULTISPECIES: flagellar hook capping FlgD N-terminal domain-containing protein [Rhodobaca]ATX65811.1 flagellar basal body rod modification protein [Rhodobaca barguzinensis]MBB4208228.1 flagellar basal-body rod modification protein FlgD [Rhodobaca bogoriensis DSM 18756]TDW38869.1 flagellar basal-body rod modification protein FlgD [Rhodobaca barguzinensis]TDY68948.1 flagellar basal-body rod modification protein FlgD [Rhodobaca bogoriensis DSM 18756]
MDMHLQPASVGRTEAGGLASPKAQNSEISSDFQTFLRMLTAQIQNQNPLEPIEASDFAVQLATFSGVEQQVRTNELLTQLTTRLGLSELANWVGRDALTPAPQFVDGSSLRLIPPDMQGSDRADLVLRDPDGQEAARYAVSPGAREILFEAPHQSEGGPRTGYYTFEIEGFRGGEKVVAAPALGYSRILEARNDAGQVFLVLEGGHQIDSTDVAGLRE